MEAYCVCVRVLCFHPLGSIRKSTDSIRSNPKFLKYVIRDPIRTYQIGLVEIGFSDSNFFLCTPSSGTFVLSIFTSKSPIGIHHKSVWWQFTAISAIAVEYKKNPWFLQSIYNQINCLYQLLQIVKACLTYNGGSITHVWRLRYPLQVRRRGTRACWANQARQFCRVHWACAQFGLLHLRQTLPIQNCMYFQQFLCLNFRFLYMYRALLMCLYRLSNFFSAPLVEFSISNYIYMTNR